MKIIAFCGRRYTGKTEAATHLQDLDSRFVMRGFADLGKEEFAKLTGTSYLDLVDQEKKDRYRSELVKYLEGEKKEHGRKYWAERFFYEFKDHTHLVIHDLRFLEELELIVKNKGVVYKVEAEPKYRQMRGWIYDTEIDNHYSETEMDMSPHTFYTLTGGGGIFNNFSNTEFFRSEIQRLLIKHMIKG